MIDEPKARSQSRRTLEPLCLVCQETRQFLIWDKDAEEDVEDYTATSLFEAAEGGGDEKPRGRDEKKSKGKKRDREESKKKEKSSKAKKAKKRSTSSSASSQSSTSSTKSSGSSQSKANSTSSSKARVPWVGVIWDGQTRQIISQAKSLPGSQWLPEKSKSILT